MRSIEWCHGVIQRKKIQKQNRATYSGRLIGSHRTVPLLFNDLERPLT